MDKVIISGGGIRNAANNDTRWIGSDLEETIVLWDGVSNNQFNFGSGDRVVLPGDLSDYEITGTGNVVNFSANGELIIRLSVGGDGVIEFANGTADLTFDMNTFQILLGDAVLSADPVDAGDVSLEPIDNGDPGNGDDDDDDNDVDPPDDDDDVDLPTNFHRLTEDDDFGRFPGEKFYGSADGNDWYEARIGQQGFVQGNRLGSGDELDGVGGTNTLMAQVTQGAYVGSGNMPIQPWTQNIQNIFLEAINHNIDGDNSEVYVNAKDMRDIEELWSWKSNANLTIKDLNTLTSDTNMPRNTEDITIGMSHTGNNDSNWNESNFKVYFDKNYFLAGQTAQEASFFYQLMDVGAVVRGDDPLDGFALDSLGFKVDGENYTLEFENPIENTPSTYDALVNYLNAELAIQYPELAGVVFFQLGGNFVPAGTFVDPGRLVILTGTDGVEVPDDVDLPHQTIDFSSSTSTTIHRDVFFDPAPAPIEGDVTSKIVLEKVGRGYDGGELVIGSMAKGSEDMNILPGFGPYEIEVMVGRHPNSGNPLYETVEVVGDGSCGVEVFEVTVLGSGLQNKHSSLSGLRSTNNKLETVIITTGEAFVDNPADLTIGNSNSANVPFGIPLKDVKDLDASGFLGNLSVQAALTDEVVPKYMDRVDFQDNPAADNAVFNYTLGAGNDNLEMFISASNLAAAGTANREDFELTINAPVGDNNIVLGIVEIGPAIDDWMDGGWLDGGIANLANQNASNWYENHQINANITINAGNAGNNTVWTPGAGDFFINTGGGNDVIYTDNTGTGDFGSNPDEVTDVMAHWVLNAADPNILDLESNTLQTYVLYKASIEVSFKGFEVVIDDKFDEFRKYNYNDLEINQAIKEAINDDDVLNKLIVAEDGPGNTLIVRSLIDGQMVVDELEISVAAANAAAFDPVERAHFENTVGLPAQNLLNAGAAAAEARFTPEFATAPGGFEIEGDDSGFESNNVINFGAGNDVLVLSTGANSNETVVFTGYNNGNNTIVNFETQTTTVTTTTVTTSADANEVVTLTFGDFEPDPQPVTAQIVFDDDGAGNEITIDLSGLALVQGLIPAQDVAFEFTQQYNAEAGTNWNAVWHANTGTVTLTHTQPGDQDDITIANFTFEETDGPIDIVVNDGSSAHSPAIAATVVVNLNGTSIQNDGTFEWNGASIDFNQGDGPATVAQYLANASFDDWNVQDNLNGTVTFRAKDVGPTTFAEWLDIEVEVEDAIEDSNPELGAGIEWGWLSPQLGQEEIGWRIETIEITEELLGVDYIDFTDYIGTNTTVGYGGSTYVGYGDFVQVNGDAGTGHVKMHESATNPGEYLINHYVGNAINLIGYADFGTSGGYDPADFTAVNFV